MKFNRLIPALIVAGSADLAFACGGCYGNDAVHVRNVRRMQPDVQNATVGPRGELEWGQLNVLHTTDTHGWLEGHLKERNYGADFGDFKSFVSRMRQKADKLKVDLLLVDTGDLHDGAGLSDATSPNGVTSNAIFQNLDYDLLSIGNHELYLSDIAYLTAGTFAKHYGDKYIASNVEIYNNASKQYEPIANKYRYFKTKHGLNVMAFGVLFDFKGNSNASRVTNATTMVKQDWFTQAIKKKPVDLFMVIGHNPTNTSNSASTMGAVYNAIRTARSDIPIQVFGGHTHIRDFNIYDEGATGLESGRYCETLGWFSMTGIKSKTYRGAQKPHGVPNPSKRAIKAASATPAPTYGKPSPGTKAFKSLRYARRYLDWNRRTFAYHAKGSQSRTFDTPKGLSMSSKIYAERQKLNLTALYGCAPKTWCQSCQPFGSDSNIFTGLLAPALAETVVNESRKDIPRLIIINTGSIRFDLVEGPFTYDDSFIVSPFADAFQFIPDVPYDQAKQVIGILNAGPFQKRDTGSSHRTLQTRDFGFSSLTGRDICVDTVPLAHENVLRRRGAPMTRGKFRRQTVDATPGYVTKDDLGTDGDDTIHSKIPQFPQPNDLQANASFPADGSLPKTVDLVFFDFIGVNYILPAVNSVGGKYTKDNILYYIDKEFDSNWYIPEYAKRKWSKGPVCPVGTGVGS